MHSGSIALFLEPGGEVVLQALEAAAAASVLVSVDPNIRPALVGDHAHALTTFERAASAADIVKLSDEDAEWLYPGLAPAQVLDAIAQHGPRIVVMTRGADGAIGRGPDGIVEVPSRSVSVVDTIGAGDSYMGSLIASALEDPALFSAGDGLARAMRRAAIVAGITVSREGADPPTRAEVDSTPAE